MLRELTDSYACNFAARLYTSSMHQKHEKHEKHVRACIDGRSAESITVYTMLGMYVRWVFNLLGIIVYHVGSIHMGYPPAAARLRLDWICKSANLPRTSGLDTTISLVSGRIERTFLCFAMLIISAHRLTISYIVRWQSLALGQRRTQPAMST
ncbi:hypothetical protein F4811DRAFT_383883 [Daldinia bambusicola]|nr:hypothetical protein F4811DRAFT_383883 [Daldinia bambusicola]